MSNKNPKPQQAKKAKQGRTASVRRSSCMFMMQANSSTNSCTLHHCRWPDSSMSHAAKGKGKEKEKEMEKER